MTTIKNILYTQISSFFSNYVKGNEYIPNNIEEAKKLFNLVKTEKEKYKYLIIECIYAKNTIFYYVDIENYKNKIRNKKINTICTI